jgi:hypothetical protein
MQSVAQILSQSDVMVTLLSPIRPYVIITRTELLGSGLDLGLTGRDLRYPNDRNRLALQFAWSNIRNRFHLASIMSHEYRHSSQALDRQFVTSEAAPFIMLQQYLVLKWWSEFEAFRFQAVVLEEIADSTPAFEPCRAALLAGDKRLRLLTDGEIEQVRRKIVEDEAYNAQTIAKEYQRYSQVTDRERQALGDVKVKAQNLLQSDEWQAQKRIWAPWIPEG